MKRFTGRLITVVLIASIVFFLAGCGGGSSSKTPTISVTSTAGAGTGATIDAGSSPTTLTATVGNDSSAQISWGINKNDGSCGTLNASGTTATYIPPAEATLNAKCVATISAGISGNTSVTPAAYAYTVNPVQITLPSGQSTTPAVAVGSSGIPLQVGIGDDASASTSAAATVSWTITGAAVSSSRQPTTKSQPMLRKTSLETASIAKPATSYRCGTISISADTKTATYTPATTGPCTDTVTATVEFGGALMSSNPTQTFMITDGTAPTITSAPVATFTVGSAGSFPVNTTGYPAPTITEVGALPSGVTFSYNVFSGVPAAGSGASYPITLTAANGIGSNATQSFTLVVDTAPAFTSAPSTTFTAGTQGSFTVTATGIPAVTVSAGTLPTWLTFNATTGVLSGTPPTGSGGSYPITFTATNAASSTIQNFTMIVDAPPAFTSASSATFTEAKAGTFTVTASGYPAPTLSAGTLPSWLSFNATTGALSGTPPTGSSANSPYSITFTASNGIGSNATQTFSLTVNQGLVAPAFTSANSTTFTETRQGTFTVAASGTPAPTISAGTLPSWLNFNATTGVLSGTPPTGSSANSPYSITFTATNSVSSVPQTFTLTVIPLPVAPSFTSGSSTTFTAGTQGTFTVTATGIPTPTISAGTLPSWLNFNATTGALSGTPPQGSGGSYPITFTASNGVLPNASQTFTLTVDAAPAFTSVNSTSFTESSAGTFTVIASGYPVPTISAGTLPSWLSFNATTGILSGTPPTGSSTNSPYTITFTAGNGIGSNATQSFSLTVSAYTAPTANVSGTVFLSDGVTPLSGVTVALSGTALSSPLTATTGSNGNFTIANVPDANIYTVTLSPPTAASSSAFYPASSSISGTTNGAFTITTNSAPPAGSGAALTGINFTAAVGYAVSGSVTYTSRQLGGFNKTIMYVTLQNTNCSTCAPQLGTSTSAVNGGTFNIDGVPPGTYILNTWADQGGLGVPNAFYSSGTTASFTVPAVTTAPVTLQTPGTAPVTTAPTMVVTPMESGVIVHYQPVMSAGVEQPLYYVLQWDQSQSTCKTDPNGPNGLASTTGYYSGNVPAGSGNIVILDSNVSGNPAVVGDPGSNITPPNFADGTALYVCMAAVESDGLTLGPWSSQQVTIGALGGSNFSSLGLNVTIPATPTLPTDNPVDLGTAPLYAGCLDENTGNIYMNSMFGVAGDPTATAGTTNNESVNVPNGAYCTTFAFVDINEDGLITPEGKNAAHVDFGPDIYNINQNVAPVSVTTSSVQNIDLTPAVENGLATVRTQSVQSMDQGGNLTSQSYNLIFDVHAQRDLPVEVELQGLTPLMGYTGPDVLQPLNLAVCTSCYSPSELGAQNDFNLTVSTAGMPPRIGDTYNLLVTYLNQTNEVTLSPAVTGVSSAFATGLTVTASSTPTFTWTYPANASSYTYQFTLTDATGKVLWQVPAANAMSNSFSSSVSASIVLGTDPLGGTNTGPSSLAAGTYQWSISAIDSNGNVDINGNIDSAGNIATVQQTFTP